MENFSWEFVTSLSCSNAAPSWRIKFVWFSQCLIQKPLFENRILSINEANFSRNALWKPTWNTGITFSRTVYCETLSRNPGRVFDRSIKWHNVYRRILEEDLYFFRKMYFVDYGMRCSLCITASQHILASKHEFLNQNFNHRWIDTGVPQSWPPRPPAFLVLIIVFGDS